MGKNKSAKEIQKLISDMMQVNKLTRADIGRGLVALDNLEHEYIWKNGLANKVDKVKTVKLKEKKPVVLEECTS